MTASNNNHQDIFKGLFLPGLQTPTFKSVLSFDTMGKPRPVNSSHPNLLHRYPGRGVGYEVERFICHPEQLGRQAGLVLADWLSEVGVLDCRAREVNSFAFPLHGPICHHRLPAPKGSTDGGYCCLTSLHLALPFPMPSHSCC